MYVFLAVSTFAIPPEDVTYADTVRIKYREVAIRKTMGKIDIKKW